jgi:hypothetical protein
MSHPIIHQLKRISTSERIGSNLLKKSLLKLWLQMYNLYSIPVMSSNRRDAVICTPSLVLRKTTRLI